MPRKLLPLAKKYKRSMREKFTALVMPNIWYKRDSFHYQQINLLMEIL
jgi:hypothetical protein